MGRWSPCWGCAAEGQRKISQTSCQKEHVCFGSGRPYTGFMQHIMCIYIYTHRYVSLRDFCPFLASSQARDPDPRASPKIRLASDSAWWAGATVDCKVGRYYSILYYVILYYIILYDIRLYYIVLYNVILYYIVLYYIILYYIVYGIGTILAGCPSSPGLGVGGQSCANFLVSTVVVLPELLVNSSSCKNYCHDYNYCCLK